MSDRRPKRRCVAAKAQRQQAPSAIHYVGYVEDDETPEMIMKKFEELERIQKAAEARRQQQQQQQPGAATSAAAGDARADIGAGGDHTAPRPGADGASAATSDQPHLPGLEQGNNQPAPHTQPLLSAASAPQAGPSQNGSLQPPSNQGQGQGQDIQGRPDGPSRHGAGGADGDGGGDGGSGSGDGGGGGGAGAADSIDAPLDEEALLEVFRQTSVINIRSALAAANDAGGGDALPSRYDAYGLSYGMEDALFVGEGAMDDGEAGSDVDEEELQGFWSDDDYETGSRSGRRRRTGGGGGGGKAERSDCGAAREQRPPRAAGAAATGASRHAMAQVVTQFNRDTNALIRRRVASGGGAAGGAGGGDGGGGLVQLRLPPPPLPLSWGRTVRPYQPPEPYRPPDPVDGGASRDADADADAAPAATAADADAAAAPCTSSRSFEAADLASFPFEAALGPHKTYIAVMVNAGWQPEGAAEAYERGGEAEVMARFRRLPIPRLVPRGFVLVWAHKGLLAAVCRQMASWGYTYVENLTWVHLTPGHTIAAQAGRHFRRSHSTMLMFRREGEGRDIELRHQRNPDVIFDCIRTRADGGGWEVPSEVWGTVETLLPGGKGAFLELWAPRGARRHGWDHVAEVR